MYQAAKVYDNTCFYKTVHTNSQVGNYALLRVCTHLSESIVYIFLLRKASGELLNYSGHFKFKQFQDIQNRDIFVCIQGTLEISQGTTWNRQNTKLRLFIKYFKAWQYK